MATTLRYRLQEDTDQPNPRHDFDPLGTFVMAHRRYEFGDRGTTTDVDEQKAEAARIQKEGGVVLPVYMYDHSGQTINTTGFSCRWDSGQIGFIWMERDTILKEYGGKRISAKRRAQVTELLRSEIAVLDQWLTGDVYGAIIESVTTYDDGAEDDVEEVDSLWGCYGYAYAEAEAQRMLADAQKEAK